MEKRKLIPYSVYLPEKHYKALKKAAKDRKASELIREAIAIVIDGKEEYQTGYNNGLLDAIEVIAKCKEANMVAFNGRDIATILEDQIQTMVR